MDAVDAAPDILKATYGHSRGHIKVFARPRAFDAAALADRGGLAVECGGDERDEITVTDEKGRPSTFGFDRVFAPTTTNASLF